MASGFRSTPGLLTLVGGAVLFAALLVNGVMSFTELAAFWDDPASVWYYVSNVPLLAGWSLLFLSNLLSLREWSSHHALWKTGISIAVLGFGAVTLGFVVVVIGPAVGGVALADRGNTIAGLGMFLGVTVGSLLSGVAAYREAVVPSGAALLLALAGPVLLLGFVLPFDVLPESLGAFGIVFWLFLAGAWALFGYTRWTTGTGRVSR